jgi:hypothetical protein
MAYAGPGAGAVVPGLGDGLILRQDAADWIKEQSEILALKPGLWGMSVDLRAVIVLPELLEEAWAGAARASRPSSAP